jgi:hypothetical protein
MPTSQIPSILSELEAGLPIPLEKRAYFHARVLNGFYQYVLGKFLEEERAGRLTRAELARRIGRKPEVISRLLGAPGNWGLETATDLLIGICGEELQPSSTPLLSRPPRNFDHAEWIRVPQAGSENAVSAVSLFRTEELSDVPTLKMESYNEARSTPPSAKVLIDAAV